MKIGKLLKIKVAPDSSEEKLTEKIRGDTESIGAINFSVNRSFTIFLHHDVDHECLRKSCGLQESDVVYEGKVTFIKDSLACLFKSSGLSWNMKDGDRIDGYGEVGSVIKNYIMKLLEKRHPNIEWKFSA